MKTQSAMTTFIRETGGWAAAQLEACTRCGLCAEACHFYQATGNLEFVPVWKMEPLRRAYEQSFTVAGRIKLTLGLEKRLTGEDLARWSRLVYEACTVCNKCAMVCPMGIQIGPLIHEVRASMASAGLVPEDLMAATMKQKDVGSPLNVTDTAWAERMDWIADEWEADIPIDKEGADTLVVFTSIELMKFPDNIAAIASIMNKAGENWTVSRAGREVVNFGYFVSDRELTKLFLGRVFDAARKLRVKRIVISECGHAYEAFRWTAANIMDVPRDIEIVHILRAMYDFWKAGRIGLKKGAYDGAPMTFHDSCKIQRRGGHIREPREMLKHLAPRMFREMSPCREQALCCGGGGGVISIRDADPQRFSVFGMKVEQMARIEAASVCMVCSNCRLQFAEGVAHFGSAVKVRGLSEMVAKALE